MFHHTLAPVIRVSAGMALGMIIALTLVLAVAIV
jgi:hypothetical protein